MSFYDTFPLFAIVTKNISSKHILFALCWIKSLISCKIINTTVAVTFHVSFKGTGAHKRETTYFAAEGSFSCVAPLVITQVAVRSKRNIANVTFIGFYAFVYPIMYFQVTSFCEKFSTNPAFKWFNTLMSSDVYFQTPGP